MKESSLERLVRSARLAAAKMKREYDRQVPDAAIDECWAEQQRLEEAVGEFDQVYSHQRDYHQ